MNRQSQQLTLYKNNNLVDINSIQNKELTIHEGIFCSHCNLPVIGKRYKCIFCFNYDLCEYCEKNGVHQEHSLIRFAKKNPLTAEEQLMYNASFCNYCNDPIVGIGYKCPQCYDFDLCNSCKRKGIHPEHHLEAFFSTVKNNQLYVFKGINCFVCNRPVIGIRYKCNVCPDYNLCLRCEKDGHHNMHPLIRITRKIPNLD